MALNPESILDSVKKVLGVGDDDTAFDFDIIIGINSALLELSQLGIGSDTGFVISDNTTLWSQYVTDLSLLGMVKQYICMVTRMSFDPPATSFGIDAVKSQIDKLTFRLNVAAETASPPADPIAVERIRQLAPAGTTVFPGGVMRTFFAPKVVILDYDPVVTPDARDGNVFYLTLRGDCVLNAPVNGVEGQHLTFGLTSAAHRVTWGRGWNFGNAGLPDVTPDKTDIISAVYRESATEWRAGFTTGF